MNTQLNVDYRMTKTRKLILCVLLHANFIVLGIAGEEQQVPEDTHQGRSINLGIFEGRWKLVAVKGSPLGEGAVVEAYSLTLSRNGSVRVEKKIRGDDEWSFEGEFLIGTNKIILVKNNAQFILFDYKFSKNGLLEIRPVNTKDDGALVLELESKK